MTAAFDDHFDGTSDRWSAKVLTRVAHSIIWILPVALGMRIAYWLGHDHWPWLRTLSNTAWLLMAFAYWVAIFHEQTPRLCVRCMGEVPTNASKRAQGFRRHFLRIMHLSRRTSYALLGALAVLIVVPLFLRSETAQIITGIPIDAFIAASVYGGWLHHRLRPWCPYCRRWDDGGDVELIPDPDPSESRKVPR